MDSIQQNQKIVLNQIQNHLEFGQTDAALNLINILLEKSPTDRKLLSRKALILFKQGHFSQARKIWTNIINDDLNDSVGLESLLCLSVHSADLGKYQESQSLFNLYSTTHAKNLTKAANRALSSSHFNSAKKLFAYGKLDNAMEECQKSLNLDNLNEDAYVLLAKILIRKNQAQKALTFLEHAIAQGIKGKDIFELKVICGVYIKNPKSIENSAQQLQRYFPNSKVQKILAYAQLSKANPQNIPKNQQPNNEARTSKT